MISHSVVATSCKLSLISAPKIVFGGLLLLVVQLATVRNLVVHTPMVSGPTIFFGKIISTRKRNDLNLSVTATVHNPNEYSDRCSSVDAQPETQFCSYRQSETNAEFKC